MMRLISGRRDNVAVILISFRTGEARMAYAWSVNVAIIGLDNDFDTYWDQALM